MPDLRYDINGVIQFFSEFISNTFDPSSISEEIWIKDNTYLEAIINFAETALARRSANLFSSFGI